LRRASSAHTEELVQRADRRDRSASGEERRGAGGARPRVVPHRWTKSNRSGLDD